MTVSLEPRGYRRRSTVEGGRPPNRVGTLVVNVVVVAITVVMAFPAYWMINTALKPASEILTFTPQFLPENPTLSNFASALNAPIFLDALRTGVIVTSLAVACALVVGFLGALAVARFRFYGRRALILTVLIVQMVPFIALLIPLYLMLNSWDLTNSLWGVTLVYIVLVLPYTVWTLRGFIASVPKELDEAALVDGCSRWQTFTRIILPLTGPGLVATALYGFILAWNEFIIINTLNSSSAENQNLMAWLLNNQTQRQTFWGPLMAGAILTSLPVVAFFLLIQRNIATGLTAGAVKG